MSHKRRIETYFNGKNKEETKRGDVMPENEKPFKMWIEMGKEIHKMYGKKLKI